MPEVENKIEDEEKSAVDIATAANVAIEIAMIAVDFIPGGKAVKLVSGVKNTLLLRSEWLVNCPTWRRSPSRLQMRCRTRHRMQ